MTDAQRVDVERFNAEIEPETEWSCAYVDMEPCKDGEWVRHSDYATLLQQVAAQAAEIALLRNGAEREKLNLLTQLHAAERASDEAQEELRRVAACLPGPYYMDPPDGGSVTVAEQVGRMALDASRWRVMRLRLFRSDVEEVIFDYPAGTSFAPTTYGEASEIDELVDAASLAANGAETTGARMRGVG